MNFNIKKINKNLLQKITDENIDSIFKSPAARKGRTREQVQKAVSIGIPCECFLIQYHDCVENTEKYGDVIRPNGMKVECKASKYKWDDTKMNQMVQKIKSYNPSDVVMFWQQIGDEYIYQGVRKI